MKTKNAKKNSKKNTVTPATSTAPKGAKTPKAAKGKAGRPLYVPKFPRKVEFTLKDFCVANEVDPETGKGPRCSKLTLIKWLGRDKARKGRSLVKRLDHTAAPDSEKGLGRKAFLFSLREKMAPDTATPATDSAAPSDSAPAPVDVSAETSAYEAQKAALLGSPTPVVDISTPAPETTPEVTPAEAVPAA